MTAKGSLACHGERPFQAPSFQDTLVLHQEAVYPNSLEAWPRLVCCL